MSSPSSYPALVYCEWLNKQLDKCNEKLVLIDVSWESAKDCREDYLKEHIPGAVYLNILDGEHNELLPRNIQTAERFQAMARGLGVNKDSHVIIYSSSQACAFFCSGRGWWNFKIFGHSNVSVLNGGLAKWKSCGYETTSSVTPVKEGNFVSKWNKSFYCKFDDVVQNLKSKKFQLCDSRPSAVHAENQIPSAKNIPVGSLLDEQAGEMKSVDQLKEVFSTSGLARDKPVVVHCNSGMGSCSLALALQLCGRSDVAVYHGGFVEWKKRYDGN